MEIKKKLSYASPHAETVEIKMEHCIADSATTDSGLPTFDPNTLIDESFLF